MSLHDCAFCWDSPRCSCANALRAWPYEELRTALTGIQNELARRATSPDDAPQEHAKRQGERDAALLRASVVAERAHERARCAKIVRDAGLRAASEGTEWQLTDILGEICGGA